MLLASPADETLSPPTDAQADDLDIAIAVERIQSAADLPVRRIARRWAGLRTFAPDRSPVVGFDPSAEGFFWLAGQGGYGFQTAPALGRSAANLVLGRPLPTDVQDRGVTAAALAPDRFRPQKARRTA
jgi:D-arginine dehydrogenase